MLNEKIIQDIIEGNMRRNAELLRVLESKGLSLDSYRQIDFHFWARNQSDAEKLKEELVRNGFNVNNIILVEGEEILLSIEAETKLTPILAASIDQTHKNTILAAQFDCIYDGWGTKI